MSGYLAREQLDRLLLPINPNRVKDRVQAGRKASHLEVYDIRRELVRIFGFGRWSADVVEMVPIFETVEWRREVKEEAVNRQTGEAYTKKVWLRALETEEGAQLRVDVGYRCLLRLTIHAPDGTTLASYTEGACGDANNFPISTRADAHDFAVKTAESQALKRCAINLGDQFGLSLYAGGSRAPVVEWSFGYLGAAPAEGEPSEPPPDPTGEQVPDETDPTVAVPEAEQQEDNRERSKPRKPNGKRAPIDPNNPPQEAIDEAQRAGDDPPYPPRAVDPPEHPRQPVAEPSPAEHAADKWRQAIEARELDAAKRTQTLLRLRTEAIAEQLGEEKVMGSVTLKAALTKEFAEAKGER